MNRLLALFAAFLLAGCETLPPHSSAALMPAAAAGGSVPSPGSPYGAAIVRNLEIGGTRCERLTGVDLANYEAARGELAALFGASFRSTLQREGYVRVALPEESDADVVSIQPATMRVSSSDLEVAVAMRDARGRLLGWYAVQYRSGSLPATAGLSSTDVLRRMFADAGEQVARAIANSR